MSKVVFWSPLQGGSGNSAHASAAAISIGMEYRLKLLLAHGGMAKERVEGAFQTGANALDHSFISFQDHGMDALERLCLNRRLSRDNIRDYTLPLLPERLDLVQGNAKSEGTMPGYRKELLQSICAVANQSYDLVLADAGCGIPKDGSGDLALLETADLIIVSLNQCIEGLDLFFKDGGRPPVMNEKPYILVLGRYDKYSHCTLNNVKRRFGYKGTIHGIPYTTDFLDAWNMRSVLPFLQRSRNLSNRQPSAAFLESIRSLNKDILTQLDMTTALKLVERGA
ncbi:hypothetical protein P4H66_06660 [Paenibacillus dokdonensis]|uniref:Uncharacterized protein n=1 Tax=Paenibacillus dokdonensis TaxID=2567944 RepID=A0ABU6GIH3_9BACL|nr:hypothetical protein [Paenibacillus dokdonensis]MEC0239537.1 hypothetical protein [Paenibacillus dokdonensis]